MDDVRELVKNPGKNFRSAPFWGWNARLEKEQLEFQIKEMKKQGMGGFFIHSREGLETPYLSDEWMDAVETSIEKAREEDLEVWIYDEDKWPSGCAGGMVSAQNPAAYTAKGLTLEIREDSGSCEDGMEQSPATVQVVGQYLAELDGNVIRTLKALPVTDTVTVPGQHQLIILRQEVSASSEWYNGYAPTDNLNPDAVRAFIQMTHERYKERFGNEFGHIIQGVFTDEPNCFDFFSQFTPGRPWLPWTGNFLSFFEQKRGYSPVGQLPFLFFEGEKSTKIRHDYWRTISELFSESYMKQIYEWCDSAHLKLTGHMLYENDLGYNIRVCGAAMPQYRYLHQPGIDLLGEQTKEYLTVKQCTSVAHQYGRELAITETYGCTGWEFDFEGQKWLGDWQFVMGIGRRCQHLALYSIVGCRKRDYPPVFNYQTSWWEYNHLMESYFARLSACTSAGEVVRDLLVIHPISSLWTKCGCHPKEDLNHLEMNMGWLDEHITSLNEAGEEYNRLAKMLLGGHHDFDFGDETILMEEAVVRDGVMQVKNGNYHTIIVPVVCSLFASTLRLLASFADQGGRLIWVGELPEMVEGEPNPYASQLFAGKSYERVDSYEQLLELLNQTDDIVTVKNEYGGEDRDILTMLRRCGNDYLLLAVNNDRTQNHCVKITFPMHARVTAYDAWTDKEEEKAAAFTENTTEIIHEFTPAMSTVFFVKQIPQKELPKNQTDIAFPYTHPHAAKTVYATFGPVADVRRTQPNVLVLDQCSYRLGDQPLSEPMDVWRAQRHIREQLHMQQVYYNGAPQRYTWIYDTCSTAGAPFELVFEFEVADIPQKDCYAVVEQAEQFEIFCNDTLCSQTGEYFMDQGMKKVRLPKLKKGSNTLRITGAYQLATELEDCFVIGDFAVSPERVIKRESGRLHFGDWCLQGYYHYAGSMIYKFELPVVDTPDQRLILQMGDYSGTLAKVCINGRSVGYLMGAAYRELEITYFMKKGTNTCEIEVVGSPRNMFGPFHQTYTGCSRISWADFRTEGAFYTDAYVLKPYGLMGQVTIYQL